MKIIDLRSDTVTRATPAMRKAIAEAEIGDDVYGEDPTVNRLQALAARMIGTEAALFVPSGTMANQIAIQLHTSPGDCVIAGANAHILRYEGGAAAALSSVQIQTIGEGGLFSADDLAAAVAPDDIHFARTTVVAVENTHNAGGGRLWPLESLRSVVEMARDRGMALHLDGARIFNAAIAAGVDAAHLTAGFDTVAFCLSKGLGAPVGSLVCGSDAHVREANRIRKRLGGGMRQPGFLAAAGIHALENHVERIATDHANAAGLASGLRRLGVAVDAEPETNIVMFRVPDMRRFALALREEGVLVAPIDAQRLRAVTHLDVSSGDVQRALERVELVLRKLR